MSVRDETMIMRWKIQLKQKNVIENVTGNVIENVIEQAKAFNENISEK